jgi:hypothetical protein
MGKKSRRRDKRDNKERGPPSAAEDHSDEYVVREIERSDPSYRLFPKLLEVDPPPPRASLHGVQRVRHRAVLFRKVPARALATSPGGVPGVSGAIEEKEQAPENDRRCDRGVICLFIAGEQPDVYVRILHKNTS